MNAALPDADRSLAILYDQQLRHLAAHYSNMDDGRARSAGYVSEWFFELTDLLAPQLFVEAGAYRADASRRIRQRHDDCRIVAFEANPYNYRQYVDELDFASSRIDYLHLAVTDRPGPVTFNLRVKQDGEVLRKVTGNSSLLRRTATDVEYEAVTVDGVTLDDFFADAHEERIALWIDVEGASRQVLTGGEALLRSADLVMIEVEEKFMWEGQWRSLDVIDFFLRSGFVPLTRDAEYDQQYNIVFASQRFYSRPEVLWSHELHSNYLTQHMGVRGAFQG